MKKRRVVHYLHVKIDPDLSRRLHERARSERRSLRGCVTLILEVALGSTASDTQPVRDHA